MSRSLKLHHRVGSCYYCLVGPGSVRHLISRPVSALPILFFCRILLISVIFLAAAVVIPRALAEPLQEFTGCQIIPTDWADGDSFRVRLSNGEEHTIRLYGADCLEWHVTDDSDARRLREQRRYFGITEVEASPEKSIELAKRFGQVAGDEVRVILATPFTIYTSFADARGDGKYSRVYAFVTTGEGQDLASLLVSKGLARAFGVYRETPAGKHRNTYRAHLADLELQAAKRGTGVWKETDWERLPQERQLQREEEEDSALAMGKTGLSPGTKLDINTAPRDDLMKLHGVGEMLANRIIEGRPYSSIEDLRRVPGIGPAIFQNIGDHLSLSAP